ncbi:hypothetical protein QBB34_21350 [Streptomyces stelliscabiei]|uniref:hypothetical protein n=1 Tax=Streptomyces stelliscabiei TaxID=146820 RepID=UPI002FF35512
MAKRPWDRPEYTQSPELEGSSLGNANNEEVRNYCLQRARAFLARAEDTDSGMPSSRQLEIASQYAMIAEAFRA